MLRHRIPRLLSPLLLATLAVAQASPTVPGVLHDELDERVRGLVLLGELGCVACHASGSTQRHAPRKRGPRLTEVAARVDPNWIESFLLDPSTEKSGTTMPHVLAGLEASERADVANAITHFLVAQTDRRFSRTKPDATGASRGRDLFHSIGCVACHAPRGADGQELRWVDSVPLASVAKRYSRDGLFEFLLDPHRVRPSGRMPDFGLEPSEARDLADYLLQSGDGNGAPWAFDAERVADGSRHFDRLGCARCHDVGGDAPSGEAFAAAPLAELGPGVAGCLSKSPVRGAPHYSLDDRQRQAIGAALRAPEFLPSEAQRAQMQFAAFNCYACHQRDGIGGPTTERAEYFSGDDENLGDAGRVPPPLTGVGAKLRPEWLADAIASGQAIRPYLHTRMPGFGAANTAELASLLQRVDRAEPMVFAPLPKQRKQVDEMRKLGHRLVGTDGLNCIACHTFRGRRAGAMAAVDVSDSTTRRLRREWFYRYMLDPPEFRADTVMPSFFPNGKSIRADLADGDATRQLDAMWEYLKEGRNAREPKGLRREPIELVVGDEAVILRRSAQDTGKRAICVGYPMDVNATFDAESLALNQVWWGKFVDAAPVWTGQGSGAARILGRKRLRLGKGAPFAVLPGEEAPWPSLTRRELGGRFLGYDLDEQRRPIFRYAWGDVTVRDLCVEQPLSSSRQPLLHRTLELESARDQTLWFRVAQGESIEKDSEQAIRVGEHARILLANTRYRLRRDGGGVQCIVPIEIQDGRGRLEFFYSWREKAK